MDHVRVLAESENPLPPILVHRPTRRVIDGMHRLRAALLKNEDTIEVEFFDGDVNEAFLAAVRTNVSHGLPLTLAERQAAAARIIRSFPARSDRSIAAITGLSAGTVGSIRRRLSPDGGDSPARIGQDGRVRPLNSADGRRVASDLIARRPDASLREIARAAGVSPATVRDVRQRMYRGDDPVPPGQRVSAGEPDGGAEAAGAEPGHRRTGLRRMMTRDRATLLRNLSRDPALRFSESGRAVLRWLHARATGAKGWEDLVDRIPPHCGYVVAELARGCAEEWAALAAHLEQRLRSTA